MFESIKQFFSNHFETDDHGKNEYATHYYGNDYNTTKNAIVSVGRNMKFKMTNVDDHYRELLLVAIKGELIFTLTNVSYYETAVDIKATTHHIVSANRTKKLVKQFYEELNRQLTLKRTGGTYNE